MGRLPCCERESVKKGQWTPEEDNKLRAYIAQHGTRNWRLIPKNAGLQRCGKSCRLRWTNYLRPDLKHGDFSEVEEQAIIKLHSVLGNRWSMIAAQLPGRTDNDVKNHWNTKLKKRLTGMGIDPITHKPFSHLIAEITTLAPPHMTHLAEAALGCFKDEVLHLLTKKRVDPAALYGAPDGFGYAAAAAASSSYCDVEGPAWSQSFCTMSTCAAAGADGTLGGGAQLTKPEDRGEETECGGRPEGGEGAAAPDDPDVFGDDSMMWDLSDDLIDAIV